MIKFEVAEDPGEANVAGTSLKGTVKTTYAELEETFGEPTIGPDERGDKTTCEWHIEFQVPIDDDGMGDTDPEDYDTIVATVYDWKYDSTPYQEVNWHVGGNSQEAVWLVMDALGK